MSVKYVSPLRKRRLRKRLLDYFPLYLMLLPGLLYFFVNNYIPMAGVIIAFKNIRWNKGILGSPWVGFKNFEFLFTTDAAWKITRNTLLYNSVFIILGTLLSITVSILLDEIRVRYKNSYQTLILTPHLISIVVVSYIVYAFLSVDSGLINNGILKPMGLQGIQWYTSPEYWPYILTLVHLWKTFGYNSILYYSSVVAVDRELYEASHIDGATRWQRIRYITIPSISPTIITLVLMSIGRIFYSDFGLFYQVPMNSGPLQNVTQTIDTYVYNALIQLNDVGMSSAAGVYQSLVGFLLVLTANYVVRRIDSEKALF